jgi:hypothetical protein
MSGDIIRRVARLETTQLPSEPSLYVFGNNSEDLRVKIAAAEAEIPGRAIVGYCWLDPAP